MLLLLLSGSRQASRVPCHAHRGGTPSAIEALGGGTYRALILEEERGESEEASEGVVRQSGKEGRARLGSQLLVAVSEYQALPSGSACRSREAAGTSEARARVRGREEDRAALATILHRKHQSIHSSRRRGRSRAGRGAPLSRVPSTAFMRAAPPSLSPIRSHTPRGPPRPWMTASCGMHRCSPSLSTTGQYPCRLHPSAQCCQLGGLPPLFLVSFSCPRRAFAASMRPW